VPKFSQNILRNIDENCRCRKTTYRSDRGCRRLAVVFSRRVAATLKELELLRVGEVLDGYVQLTQSFPKQSVFGAEYLQLLADLHGRNALQEILNLIF